MKVYVVYYARYDEFDLLKVFFKELDAFEFKEKHPERKHIYVEESEIV